MIWMGWLLMLEWRWRLLADDLQRQPAVGHVDLLYHSLGHCFHYEYLLLLRLDMVAAVAVDTGTVAAVDDADGVARAHPPPACR